jgi:hypothetical protein
MNRILTSGFATTNAQNTAFNGLLITACDGEAMLCGLGGVEGSEDGQRSAAQELNNTCKS